MTALSYEIMNCQDVRHAQGARSRRTPSTIVFTNTRSGTENVVYKLKERGMESIEAHHGSLCEGDQAGRRGAAEERPAAVRRVLHLARAGHRHRLRRSGVPDRFAEVRRQGHAAHRAQRPLARQDGQGPDDSLRHGRPGGVRRAVPRGAPEQHRPGHHPGELPGRPGAEHRRDEHREALGGRGGVPAGQALHCYHNLSKESFLERAPLPREARTASRASTRRSGTTRSRAASARGRAAA